MELSPEQTSAQAEYRAFVESEIRPYADTFDQEERIPADLIQRIFSKGYLGALIPKAFGGKELNPITYGLLTEEIGKGCSSVRSLLTVHDMVAVVLAKWGTKEQKERWLPKLALGETIGAFALTEPNVGSDAKSIQTTAQETKEGYILNGYKEWITYGQIAHLFLLFAQVEGKPTAFLVERSAPGLSIEPIFNLLGTRASMLAKLHLKECVVPLENLVGKVGFGFSHIASTALDQGRYSVAWGCVGIAQACLEASIHYSNTRQQFGQLLREQQMIRRMVAHMVAQTKASRLLCWYAGSLKEKKDPNALMETNVAKYFASTALAQITSDAVQIHGGNGCGGEYPVQRYFRDAKVMEIIEGSTQMQQLLISKYGYQEMGV